MADSMETCKMLWANRYCCDNQIWARRRDPVAYQLVLTLLLDRMAPRLETLVRETMV